MAGKLARVFGIRNDSMPIIWAVSILRNILTYPRNKGSGKPKAPG